MPSRQQRIDRRFDSQDVSRNLDAVETSEHAHRKPPITNNLLSNISKTKYEIFADVATEVITRRHLRCYPHGRCLRLIRVITELYDLILQKREGHAQTQTLYVILLENVLALSHELDVDLASILSDAHYHTDTDEALIRNAGRIPKVIHRDERLKQRAEKRKKSKPNRPEKGK